MAHKLFDDEFMQCREAPWYGTLTPVRPSLWQRLKRWWRRG